MQPDSPNASDETEATVRQLRRIAHAAETHGGDPSQYVVAGERVHRPGNRAEGMSLAQAASQP